MRMKMLIVSVMKMTDDRELEHDAFISMKRIGCFAHSFQLPVVGKKFDDYVGFCGLLK